MASEQDIARRIGSVTNTRKITRAMEMVSAAKLRRAQVRIETLRPFADSVLELTVRVAQGIQAGSPNPLLQEREIKRVCIVMFTGDRGLAGALNANVLRRSLALRAEWEAQGAEVRWIGVGKKGASSLVFRKITVDKAYRGITDAPKFRDAEEIGQAVIEQFNAGEYDKVILVYNNFVSAVQQAVIVQDLLPLTDELLVQALAHMRKERRDANPKQEGRIPLNGHQSPDLATHDGKTHVGDHSHSGTEKGGKYESDWFFEPDSQLLLDRLLPTYIEQTVFRALLESTASEHGARMSAMRNASENAKELIDQLTLQRNRARQAKITQQILEIVAGADAL